MAIVDNLRLSWGKCQGDQWCDLLRLNLNHLHFHDLEGVYIIWHGAPDPKVVRVGQGIIRDRLSSHRIDNAVLEFADRGLYVTWAAVPISYRDGVERFLAEKWHPIVGTRFPDAVPIAVNSPWE